jgi:predicted amidophosphoribosyltransferase
MSNLERPNFFVLLDIDPTKQWSSEEFEKVLKAKRIDWTKKSTDVRPKVKLEAKKNLERIALITQVMSDEASRKNEAAAAVKQQSQAQKEIEQKFHEDLQLITAKGFITKSEISTLVKNHAISEAEILKELNKQGVTIREEIVNNDRDKSIDPITLNGIKENLDKLKEKKSNLYQFLDLNQNTSISALQKKSDDIYNQSQTGKRDTESTIIGNLAGFSKKVFKNEEMREAYDRALQAEVYDLLKERINKLASSSDRTIHAQQFALLLELAKSKKLDLEKSKKFIIEQAQERKLAVQIPDLKLIDNKIACISCETLNDRQNNYCTGCRSSLKITCPSCGQVSTVEDRACSKCSFPIGNEGNIREYLAVTQQLLNAKLYDEAIANLKEAKQSWTTNSSQPLNDPLTQEIERYLQEAQQKQQQRVTVQKRLLDAINDRRFYEARTVLEQIERERINIDLDNSRNRIETSIREAETELTKARTLEKSGRDPVEL